MVLERAVQKIERGKGDSYTQWERKWIEIEQRLGGFSVKSYYMLISGAEPIGTLVWEREWPDMACMEQAYNRLFADPEVQGLQVVSPVLEERRELYFKETDILAA